MREARLILVTGLPGTGKTTFARSLAERLRVPLLTKDSIKEPLLDCLGAADAAESRRLSDASFAVLFALTGEIVARGGDVVIEGNFRPDEHEAAFGAYSARIAQVLCVLDESQRLARLAARASDPARHTGHRDGDLVQAMPAPRGDTFLALPGARFRCDGGGSISDRHAVLFRDIEQWWHAH